MHTEDADSFTRTIESVQKSSEGSLLNPVSTLQMRALSIQQDIGIENSFKRLQNVVNES